jgi:hypothetical protein
MLIVERKIEPVRKRAGYLPHWRDSVVTNQDIKGFRQRAQVCRAEAELTFHPECSSKGENT